MASTTHAAAAVAEVAAATAAAVELPASTDIIVVGAGLTGSLLACTLGRRGFKVLLLERRSDLRAPDKDVDGISPFGHATHTTKRSINLALSKRGEAALEHVGLLDRVLEQTIAMTCRAMHPANTSGKLTFQPYGTKGEAIKSISRTFINETLLDAADEMENVTMLFEHRVTRCLATGGVVITTPTGETARVAAKLVCGADGAFSAVRASMMRIMRLDYSQHYIEHGYKELTMPPKDGDFAMQPMNALHIWPRHEFMMIALPNPDKTYTCTLFAPFSKMDYLSQHPDEIEDWFQDTFPDAVDLVPEVKQQYLANPTGSLVTVKCDPWNFSDKIVLLGDAAHAIVPFFGQGMNAGFDDVMVLEELLTKHNNNLTEAIPEFAAVRKPAGDAIAEMSFANYVEMRSHTASTSFLMRKRFEGVLHWLMPSLWTPLYTMVAFTRKPYDKVIEQSRRQDTILSWLMTGTTVAALAGGAYLALKASSKL